MRRLVTIFLLVLMPMQLSWAALSAYCPHETGLSVRQVDDHNHKHAPLAAADQEDLSDPHASGSADADSGVCHAGHGTALFGSRRQPAVSVSSETYTAYQIEVPSPPHLPLPERPNWADLA
jgi:cytochrome c553